MASVGLSHSMGHTGNDVLHRRLDIPRAKQIWRSKPRNAGRIKPHMSSEENTERVKTGRRIAMSGAVCVQLSTVAVSVYKLTYFMRPNAHLRTLRLLFVPELLRHMNDYILK